VADGGTPITRVASRIDELRQDGVAIADGAWRSSFKVYLLAADAPAPGSPARLFEPGDAA